MTERVDEKIIERIRKLLAKAESAKSMGSEAEAHAFMEGVQKMLQKYKLDMSDLEAQEQDPVKMHLYDPDKFGMPRKQRRAAWSYVLAKVVAEAHFCRVISIRQSNQFWLVGRRSDRMIAELMYTYLMRTAEELAEKAYVKFFYECRDRGAVHEARGYKANFLEGFVTRIMLRYTEEREALERELREAKRHHALVRLSQETAAVKVVMDKLDEEGFSRKGSTPGGTTKQNIYGLAEGHAAGEKVRIRGTGLNAGEENNKARRLTEAPKQLGSGV